MTASRAPVQSASLAALKDRIVRCRQCDRLVAYREAVALEKRRAFRSETYWGRPVSGFGDPSAALIIVGLAPAAHGANRTGRMFTGDRSGDFLFGALHRAGLASQAESRHLGDGLSLRGVYITAACRCAPPDNKPAPSELTNCRAWLEEELTLLPNACVYLALGKTGYDAVVRASLAASGLARREYVAATQLPPFAHGISADFPDPRGEGSRAWLYASYHVSQQNTQTGRLTPAMFDAVVTAAGRRAKLILP